MCAAAAAAATTTTVVVADAATTRKYYLLCPGGCSGVKFPNVTPPSAHPNPILLHPVQLQPRYTLATPNVPKQRVRPSPPGPRHAYTEAAALWPVAADETAAAAERVRVAGRPMTCRSQSTSSDAVTSSSSSSLSNIGV